MMKKIFIILCIATIMFTTACKSNPYTEEEMALTGKNEFNDDVSASDTNEGGSGEEKQEYGEIDVIDSQTVEKEEESEEEIPPLVPIENGVYRRTEPFEGLPQVQMSFSEYLPFASLDEYTKDFDIEDYIIFKGVKKKDSTSFVTVKDSVITDWYSETPIEVVEAYYGDIKPGDEIIFKEWAVVLGENDNKHVGRDDGAKVLMKETEYLLFLHKGDEKSEDGRSMYSYISMTYSIQNFAEIEEIIKLYGQDKLSGFGKDIYDKYYRELDKLDTRIDVEEETGRLLKKNGTDELTENQKALIEKLSKQYGTK